MANPVICRLVSRARMGADAERRLKTGADYPGDEDRVADGLAAERELTRRGYIAKAARRGQELRPMTRARKARRAARAAA